MKKITRIDGDVSARAERAIAHGALTNSKRPESFVRGVYPTHLKKGKGAYVWDLNDNSYIDFISGLGSSLFGHAQEEVTEAIVSRAKMGTTLSLGTDLEVRCAEKVKELFPFIDKLRFLKSGSDATTAALTIARSFTGRNLILSSGYHGWTPEFTSLTPPAHGITPHSFILPFATIDQITRATAAVIVEPVITDWSPEHRVFLKKLRQKCNETGTLLIFDEIITGFRWLSYSVSQNFDVIPDLICLGKAIAGGMPLSIVGGRKDIMDSQYFVSSTCAGETLSLAAALKTMELLQSKFNLETLWVKGLEFLDKVNTIKKGLITFEGYPTRAVLKSKDSLTKALFMQECCKAGILIGSSPFFNFSHIELMDEVLSIFKDILTRIELGSVKLEGEMPKAAFAQITRETQCKTLQLPLKN